MRKNWKIAILAGAMLAGIGGTAAADPRVRFSVSIGAPPVYAPYYPAPVYYSAPPAVYYTPPVVYRTPVRVIHDRHPHWRRHAHHRHHGWR